MPRATNERKGARSLQFLAEVPNFVIVLMTALCLIPASLIQAAELPINQQISNENLDFPAVPAAIIGLCRGDLSCLAVINDHQLKSPQEKIASSTNNRTTPLHRALLDGMINEVAVITPNDIQSDIEMLIRANIDFIEIDKRVDQEVRTHYTEEEWIKVTKGIESKPYQELDKQLELVINNILIVLSEEIYHAFERQEIRIGKLVKDKGGLSKSVEGFFGLLSRQEYAQAKKSESPPAFNSEDLPEESPTPDDAPKSSSQEVSVEEWKEYLLQSLLFPYASTSGLSGIKILRGKLVEPCFCAVFWGSRESRFRCTAIIKVASSAKDGTERERRILQAWDFSNNRWGHVYTDHHELDQCIR